MKRAAKSKPQLPMDPFARTYHENLEPEAVTPDQASVGILHDRAAALLITLRALLLATRVRSVAGYKPFRCYACDYPHVNGTCRGDCVHHKAVELLKEMGVEGLENLQ